MSKHNRLLSELEKISKETDLPIGYVRTSQSEYVLAIVDKRNGDTAFYDIKEKESQP